MYSFVVYSLSGIQKGIQSGHSNDEYGQYVDDNKCEIIDGYAQYVNTNKSDFKLEYENYIDWRKNHKTVILLCGGSTNTRLRLSMEKYLAELNNMGVLAVPFYEPDLNDAMTSLSFIVDERVYDSKKYPDYYEDIKYSDITDERIENDLKNQYFRDYIENIGGILNYKLRYFLRGKKLASN